MALFMVQNNLTEQDVYDKGDVLDFPQSVVEFFEGRIGIPYQGFPEKLQKIVLKGKKPLTERPGKSLAPVDFEAIRQKLTDAGYKHEDEDINAYCQYPKVFKDFNETVKKYGDVSVLDTPTFFFGMKKNEEVHVEIEEGKDLIITLINISDPDDSGIRTITFMFNGAEREIQVQDKSVDMKTVTRRKADPDKAGDIGATLSGSGRQSPGHQGPESQERRTVSRYGSDEDGNDHYVSYRRYGRRNLRYQRPSHHQW